MQHREVFRQIPIVVANSLRPAAFDEFRAERENIPVDRRRFCKYLLRGMALAPFTGTAWAAHNRDASNLEKRVAWFRKAGYGIFVHWQTNSEPKHGRKLSFEEAVERFPVEAFAEQIAESGAGYVIFTITHVLNHFPFPLPEMDRIFPGRTCSRDLMADLSAALKARGVRLMFYTSWQCNDDPEFGAAVGWQTDMELWQDTMCSLMSAVATRYGNKLSGWWIDNCRHNKWNNWAEGYDLVRMAKVLRKGNKDRILAFNVSRPIPPEPEYDRRVTGIADYAAGHLRDQLLIADAPIDKYGLQAHWAMNMDGDWVFTGGNHMLRFTDEEVIRAVKANMANGAVFSYGVAPSQEGLIDGETMRQLRALRDAVRR